MAFSGPVFLVGCPRSGTTLLQRMLDAHSEVAIAPETHFVRRFWLRRQEYGDLSEDDRWNRVIDDVIAMPEFADMGLDGAALRESARTCSRAMGPLFRLLLDEFARLAGARIAGEKTPNHLLYMPELEEMFPEARFVHIVRDPRAVVNSWRGVPWSTGGVIGDAFVWRRYMTTARRNCLANAAALMVVGYEDLVAGAEAVLKAVCQFIGVEFESGMFEFHSTPGSTLNTDREPWKEGANAPLGSGRIDAWRDELTGTEIACIEAVARSEMQNCRYVPVYGAMVAGCLAPAVWSAEYLRRGIRRFSRHEA